MKRGYIAIFIITGCVVGGMWWYGYHVRGQQHLLSVAYLDVGQGDAILIEAPDGTQVLIDGGQGSSVLRALGRQMSFFDRSIDVVIATHPDEDHIGGLPEVLHRYKVGVYIDPGLDDGSVTYNAILNELSLKGIPHQIARRGMSIILDRDVTLEILFPDRPLGNVEANTASVVARLVYGNTSFLFTGDSPVAVEEYLAGIDGAHLKSDVLKLGHHGSRTSNSEVFYDAVEPRYAIISAGRNNRFGHPHEETLASLALHQIPFLATYIEGTIVIKSDGRTIFVKNK